MNSTTTPPIPQDLLESIKLENNQLIESLSKSDVNPQDTLWTMAWRLAATSELGDKDSTGKKLSTSARNRLLQEEARRIYKNLAARNLLEDQLKEAPKGRGKGLTFNRYFTKEGIHPYDEVEWEIRDAVISDAKGNVVFEQKGVEIPKPWSQMATNVVVSKYFRGKLDSPERETSVKQILSRVADTIVGWGKARGYFANEESAEIYHLELLSLLLHQRMAFNSPVWFNLGVREHPQSSACFINSVEDNMESIMALAKTEALLFKEGSGTGTNLSPLRSKKEYLSGGGTSSGPVSFMKGYDSFAAVVKSGGRCFREGTLISTPRGMVAIEKIRKGELVLTHKGPRKVTAFMNNGVRQCYLVKTIDGFEIEVTAGHKLAYWDYASGSYQTKPIEEFRVGEPLHILLAPSEGGRKIELKAAPRVAIRHSTTMREVLVPTELTPKLAYVLGLLYGDGYVMRKDNYRTFVSFAKDRAGLDSAKRFTQYCTELFGEAPRVFGTYDNYQEIGYSSKRLQEFLELNGMLKGMANNLVFPKVLFEAFKEVRAAFIAGYIDAEGTYQVRGGWNISSVDPAFLKNLQKLILTLGIPSKLNLNRAAKGKWQDLYRLNVVGREFVSALTSYLKPHSSKANFNYIPSDSSSKGWGYPTQILPYLRPLLTGRGDGTSMEGLLATNRTTGYGAMLALSVAHPPLPIRSYSADLTKTVVSAIASISPTQKAPTYDIEVEDAHMLAANGIYSSNSRRAAKMIVLNADHGDVEEFINSKAIEEKKAHSLIAAGYDAGFNVPGGAYDSVFFQNANHSVRVPDAFMQAVMEDREWYTKAVTTGETIDIYRAKDLMRQMAQAAWECGDPGIQYDTIINDWHTVPNSGKINASNPCSEFLFLDDTACNLASINLMKFRRENGEFDIDAFRMASIITITAQEMLVSDSSYPTRPIEKNSHDYRPLGLGYANLGALLMARGLAYDSEAGRQYAAAITALMSGEAYAQSALIAREIGVFAGYPANKEPMLRVINKHRKAAYNLGSEGVPEDLMEAAQASWDKAAQLGDQYGFRNAQISVCAPTGTIAFMMDCDTTGIEPDIALVKYKRLVGGGMLKIVNMTVEAALRRLGYNEAQTKSILDYITEHDTIEGAPELKNEHLSVFDCAFKPQNGERSIHYMGHLKMLSATQPFFSGSISKTVNMPENTTVEEIEQAYIEGWKMGLKCIAIYRDGCKKSQPLSTSKDAKDGEGLPAATALAGVSIRRPLPTTRQSVTHHFSVGGHDGYIIVGLYEDGTPGEVFLSMAKEGSTLAGLMDSFGISISLALQHGVPLRTFIMRFSHMRFEPQGFTGNKEIPIAKSIVDYIFRWLATQFLDQGDKDAVGVISQTTPLTADFHELPSEEPVAPAAAVAPRNIASAASGAAPAAPAHEREDTITFQGQEDAPSCSECGGLMVRNASCYKCLNCGATSGCS